MDSFEALWAYQAEDIKADAISREIKRSPTRQKLEKARDTVMECQRQYKEIEDGVAAISDRTDVLNHAIERAIAERDALEARMNALDEQDAEAFRSLMEDAARNRDELRQFENELKRMNADAAAYDKQLRTVRLDAVKAKQSFDQLKVDYDNESGARKAELEQQRARVKSLESTVDPALLAEYMAIKKHTSPPVARLQYGQCSGCNTSLPSATLSKIRNGNLVECETCGRMIIQ